MFGLSLGEILVILIIAVVFIGPKEIPIVLRFLSNIFAKLKIFQKEASTFFSDIHEASLEEELSESKDDTNPSSVDTRKN